jgi:hypothetical protein
VIFPLNGLMGWTKVGDLIGRMAGLDQGLEHPTPGKAEKLWMVVSERILVKQAMPL